MNKIKVVFIRKHSDNYFIVKSIFVKSEKVKFMKKDYILDLKNVSYISIEKSYIIFEHIINVYFMDIDTSKQISLQLIDSNIAHECLDLFLTHAVAVQLAKRMGEQSLKERIIFLVMGIAAGIGVGIAIGMNIMMKKLETGVVVSV